MPFLTDAQLEEEIERCEFCAEKPCKEACPSDCSPADFIQAMRSGEPSDVRRAAALIQGANPLGGVCGAVCPDRHCMSACVHRTFDAPIDIPSIQATIIQKAKDLGVMPVFARAEPRDGKVAIVGGGPTGYAAAATLAQQGYAVRILEREKVSGGMADLIPRFRLDASVLQTDIEWILGLGDIQVTHGVVVEDPADLLTEGYDAVVLATGLDVALRLPIPGEPAAVSWTDFLRAPRRHSARKRRVAIVGGGAVAIDVAETAMARGAEHVELFALESIGEMPLTDREIDSLLHSGIHVSGRTRLTAILTTGRRIRGITTRKVALPHGKRFRPDLVVDVKGTDRTRKDIDLVVFAIGARPGVQVKRRKGVFPAGDLTNGPTTVVEAVAAGKNAALEVEAFLEGQPRPRIARRVKNRVVLAGLRLRPVPLDTDFFGRRLISPFLLSAAPPSDGYEQMRLAYEAGWAGGVMKTAFDGLPIHIPAAYMFAFSPATFANCDNVSGHALDRVCREVERLRSEFPDRLTMASTGGPVTGHDEEDRAAWQANTRKLEGAGVMGIEYSLSCPQGGDGTKGDIVSQDAELTARIIDWVMACGAPDVPKLFKLTAAVTSIYPIMAAIKEVFDRYPGKQAGVTLANTFPTLAFRKGAKASWEEGVVVGMSGEAVTPISYLTLANVARHGISVSGNGGPMDYKAAANFLALGARNVQFCTIVMKYGYGIIEHLDSGLSHLLEARGIDSVEALIGCALPDPITGFMELSSEKGISAVHPELCQHCGNCTRCPYLAVSLDRKRVPVTDPSCCIGCSICVQKCFSGALYMRARTPKEKALLRED